MHFLIQQLARRWRGPAIEVVVGTQRTQFGKGQPKATVTVKRPAILWRMVIWPSLTFGEAYMHGDLVIEGDLMAILQGYHQSAIEPKWMTVARRWLSWIPDTLFKAIRNARHHYDIGNDFYFLWLDSWRTYSCAYFLDVDDSPDAVQWQKRELLCRKLRLKEGQTLLDIGCGWGALMFHAAERYGVKVHGITPAKEQAQFVRAEARRRGVEDKVTVQVGDWRQVKGRYDRIVSVGMFEHVGRKQYPAFFRLWARCLADDGVSLLHTVGDRLRRGNDLWFDRYIFPGGMLPTAEELTRSAAREQLLVMDIENLRQHYAETLRQWGEKFMAQRQRVVDMFDEEFAKMWWLHFQASEAGFRWGDFQLYQVVMTKKGSTWPWNREVGVDTFKDIQAGLAQKSS